MTEEAYKRKREAAERPLYQSPDEHEAVGPVWSGFDRRYALADGSDQQDKILVAFKAELTARFLELTPGYERMKAYFDSLKPKPV